MIGVVHITCESVGGKKLHWNQVTAPNLDLAVVNRVAGVAEVIRNYLRVNLSYHYLTSILCKHALFQPHSTDPKLWKLLEE